MKCHDCGFDNVPGVDDCVECGSSLVGMESGGNELERGISAHSISVLSPRPPICVAPSLPVREAIAQMAQHEIGCLLVEEDAELVGVFTERDLLNKVSGDPNGLDRPVADFMTAAPVTITKHDSIAFALQTMTLGGYRHLPVVNSSNIAVGIISVRDILRFLGVKYARSRA
jgi:CBS domain-containing protein